MEYVWCNKYSPSQLVLRLNLYKVGGVLRLGEGLFLWDQVS